MNVEPTALQIEDMAYRLREYADKLMATARSMRDKQELEYAADAANHVANCIMNLRLDVLIARPIRELQSELFKAENKNV